LPLAAAAVARAKLAKQSGLLAFLMSLKSLYCLFVEHLSQLLDLNICLIFLLVIAIHYFHQTQSACCCELKVALNFFADLVDSFDEEVRASI
jgi:hypothetical protein